MSKNFKNSFLQVFNGEKPDIFPALEFFMFWAECEEKYKKRMNGEDYYKHFGLGKILNIPYDFGPFPPYTEEIISDDGKYILKRVSSGILYRKEKNSSAMPQYIDFPIKDRHSFEKFIKKLNANAPERYLGISAFAEKVKNQDLITQWTFRGIFAFMRDFIKFDELMFLFVDDVEFVEEMISFHTDFLIKSFQHCIKYIKPDIVYFGEDLAFKGTTMISPASIERYIAPNWEKVIRFVKDNCNAKVILDSDGNIEKILDIINAVGFDIILPVERAAGMDPEHIRKLYPTLGMIGGVDKLQIAKGKAEIDEEVKKALRTYNLGYYIPCIDHSVPPIISYENYAYYIDCLKKQLS